MEKGSPDLGSQVQKMARRFWRKVLERVGVARGADLHGQGAGPEGPWVEVAIPSHTLPDPEPAACTWVWFGAWKAQKAGATEGQAQCRVFCLYCLLLGVRAVAAPFHRGGN